MEDGSRILELIDKHEGLRKDCVNLIASENFLSQRVRDALAGDLAGRYHTSWYGGSRYSREIITETEELARRLFNVKHALVTPLSGNICDLVMLFAFSSPGDRVAMPPFFAGGYPLGLEKFDRVRADLPIDTGSFRYDLEAARQVIENVRLIYMGSSFIPFPHPVKELSEHIDGLEDPPELVYDGAHVLGLMASGEFQDPLGEGASVLFGSTHKTLYGPQGGMILTNSDEHEERMRAYLDIDLETGIGLVDNPHVNRIAALGLALEELLADPDYGGRVIKNARILAKALEDNSVPMRFGDRGYTESHQIFIDMEPEPAQRLCGELEKDGIFIDVSGRLGLAELTRRGCGADDLQELAVRISGHYSRVVR